MSDKGRCDYCGHLADLREFSIYWTAVDVLSNGDQLHIPGVYCTPYCADRATSQAGTGRG